MSRNNVLVVLVSLLLVVGFAYLFLNPKYGPQVEIARDNNENIAAEPTPESNDQNTDIDFTQSGIDQDQAAELAKSDLESTGVDISQVTVTSIQAEDFSDASLGCPQEGEVYAQVITPGYTIMLEAQGVDYDYRVSADGNSVLMCSK